MKNFMKNFLLFFIFTIFLIANSVEPAIKVTIDNNIEDIAFIDDNKLLIATDGGEAKIYDYKKKQFVKSIKLPKIKDFTGEIIDAKIFSVDFIDNQYLLLSDSGVGGYSNLDIFKDGNLSNIFNANDKLVIVKAKFIDSKNILLGFLTNEIALYNLDSKKMVYKEQLSESKFSNFALNEDKTLAAVSCESGEVFIVNTKSGKIKKVLRGVNLDNVYAVDIKQNLVATAGKDRKGVVYNLNSDKKIIFKSDFPIFATALSKDASLVAFPLDESGNITIFKIFSKEKVATLKGEKGKYSNICFKNNQIFGAINSTIYIWKKE